MTQGGNTRLEAAPGRLTVRNAVSGPDEKDTVLKPAVWPAEKRRETLSRFASSPADLYLLLQGKAPDWLLEAGLLPAGAEWAGLEPSSRQAEVARLLALQPALALTVRGLSLREIEDGAFAGWADYAAERGGGKLGAEVARLERRGPAHPADRPEREGSEDSAGESPHRPGQAFYDIRPRPLPEKPEVAPASREWEARLPQLPRVRAGIDLLRLRGAEAALRRGREAARVPKPQR